MADRKTQLKIEAVTAGFEAAEKRVELLLQQFKALSKLKPDIDLSNFSKKLNEAIASANKAQTIFAKEQKAYAAGKIGSGPSTVSFTAKELEKYTKELNKEVTAINKKIGSEITKYEKEINKARLAEAKAFAAQQIKIEEGRALALAEISKKIDADVAATAKKKASALASALAEQRAQAELGRKQSFIDISAKIKNDVGIAQRSKDRISDPEIAHGLAIAEESNKRWPKRLLDIEEAHSAAVLQKKKLGYDRIISVEKAHTLALQEEQTRRLAIQQAILSKEAAALAKLNKGRILDPEEAHSAALLQAQSKKKIEARGQQAVIVGGRFRPLGEPTPPPPPEPKGKPGLLEEVGEYAWRFAKLATAYNVFFGIREGIGALINGMIQYNKTLETAKLGVAAIVTSIADVKDAQGRTLEGAEKFAAAQVISAQVQKDLRKEALLTSATYEELVQVYQGIVGPALSAKVAFQDITRLTTLLTNATKTMSLPLNQAVQEARDLLMGGIDVRGSQLATALGITNNMVKKWREGGTVMAELEKRLQGFAFASNELANTWEGVWSNLKDATAMLLGEGGKPLFEGVKKSILELTNLFVTVKKEGDKIVSITVNPEMQNKVESLAKALMLLVDALKLTVKWSLELADLIGKEVVWVAGAAAVFKLASAFTKAATEAGGLVLLLKGKLLPLLKTLGLTTPTGIAATIAGLSAKLGYDTYQNQKFGNEVRNSFIGEGKNKVNLSGLGDLKNIEKIRETYPGATPLDIASYIAEGGISFPEGKVSFNEEKIAAILKEREERQAKFKVVPKKTTTDEKDKHKEAIRAIEQEIKAAQELAELEAKSRVGYLQRGLITSKEQGVVGEELHRLQEDAKKEELRIAQETIDEKIRLENVGWSKKQALLKKGTDEEKKELAETQKNIVKLLQDREQLETNIREQSFETRKARAVRSIEEQIEAQKAVIEQAKAKFSFDEETRKVQAERGGDLVALNKDKQKQEIAIANEEIALTTLEINRAIEKGERESVVALQNKRTQQVYLIEGAEALTKFGRELLDADRQSRLIELDRLESKAKAVLFQAQIKGDIEAELKAEKELLEIERKRLNIEAETSPNQEEIKRKRDEADEKERRRKLKETPWGSFQLGIEDTIKDWGDWSKQMQDLAASTAKGMQGAFEDFFFDAMTGKLKSFKDYFLSFLNSIQRTLAKNLSETLTKWIMQLLGMGGNTAPIFGGSGSGTLGGGAMSLFGSIAKFFGGGSSIFSGGLSSALFGNFFNAGIAGSSGFAAAGSALAALFHNGTDSVKPRKAYRFHNGLAPDEIPAILQTGERVLSRGDNSTFSKKLDELGNSNASGGGPSTVVIQAMDSQSFIEFCKKNPAAILGPLSRSYKRGGTMYDMISGDR